MSEPTTPLMRQYHSIKTRYPHALVLFRLGDFYELFHEDAIVASRELQITLTSRNRERGKPIPMCGVPYHAAENYVARLIRAGYKVALCDQMEQPGPGKKLVRREVTRVVTPGTAVDSHLLEPRENNFLAAVAYTQRGGRVGLAWVDISTGEFSVTEFGGAAAEEKLRDEIHLLRPREILLERVTGLFTDSDSTGPGARFAQRMEVREGAITRLEEWIFHYEYGERALTEQFGIAGLDGLGLTEHPAAATAAGAIVHYLRETSAAGNGNGAGHALQHLDRVRYYEQQEALGLDSVSVRNLELVAPLFPDDASAGRAVTLLAALDETATGMGARLLRSWIVRPQVDVDEIEARLDAVAGLKSHTVLREEIREAMRGMQDLERLTSRITVGLASPRDLVALRASLARVPLVRGFLSNCASARLVVLREQMDELGDVATRIETTIADDPPALANDPGVIRRGFDPQLDELRELGQRGRQFIAAMEERERKRTGIGSLKIRYNQVFGFYIEISRANLHNAPPDYDRKQTLTNAERFTSPELKEYERKVLEADGQIAEIERRLFAELREWIAAQAPRLRKTATAIAQLDVLVNFARLAAGRNYARPEFTDEGELVVIAGRHPVIEQLLEQRGERFVPNDIYLNDSSQQILLITGPNMGGKSTYLRQAALIIIMAQMGSFVPATQAKLPVTDRIFTRIGASDNLARGRSTFLVEMNEVAAILNTATPSSLVVLDEVGRGTATFDGLSIAWSVVEHLQSETRARTLFATHYHELTELAELLPGVKNVHVAVSETPAGIVFLKHVEAGSADRSYGIEVARLAGLPRSVIERAREILLRHESSEHELTERLTPGAGHSPAPAQQPMFTAIDREILDALHAADVDNLKPIDALNLIARLKKQIT
ncbi:MAG TPA: DNA mismatch repair protein MutS [Candidatus Acidoferrales bacterium]|jgi:DNA mismatch repair protein MutS|nr:DNA mismatch repair protein MutS [Candidatus Acidoferrales bacterium]